VHFESLQGRTALLVDDEAFFLSSLVEWLRTAAPGLEVMTASDGVEALEQLARRPVDAVVTDVQMPRLDGYGLMSALRERRDDVDVIVMTAFGRPSEREREALEPAIDFLEKPIDFEHLLEVLGQIMHARASRDSTKNPHPPTTETKHMDNTTLTLQKINDISGALGTALVDYESGMTLGTYGTGIDLEIAAAGNMEVMRAKQRVMKELGIEGGIEDMLITLQDQYHIIRPLGTALFLYLALSRKDANLAMARRKLANFASELDVG